MRNCFSRPFHIVISCNRRIDNSERESCNLCFIRSEPTGTSSVLGRIMLGNSLGYAESTDRYQPVRPQSGQMEYA